MTSPTEPTPSLLVGANIDPNAADPEAALALAELAENLGYDLALVQDHPYNPAFLDTWTFLVAIAMRTRRLRVGANVSPLPLRPPAMLAKAAVSLDALSGGRALLGLGAGGFLRGIAAFGGPELSAGASVAALDEGGRLIRQLWEGDAPVSFAGEYHRVRGVRFGPQPTTPIPIWIGAIKPRMLRLTGRLADGLIVTVGYVPPATLPEVNAQVDAGAAAAGRPATAIHRAYNVMGTIGVGGHDTEEPAKPVGAGGSHDVATWARALTGYATAGRIDTFVFWPTTDPPDQLRRFIEEVVPAVRAAVKAKA